MEHAEEKLQIRAIFLPHLLMRMNWIDKRK
jgi:hypothetical protein